MRRISGPSSGSRRKRRWNSPRSSSTPSTKRIRSIASSSSAAPAGTGSPSAGKRQRQPAPGSTASARSDDAVGSRLPGPDQDRAALDVQQPRRHPALDPQRPVVAAPRQPRRTGVPERQSRRADTSSSERFPAHRPLSGRAGGRRRGRSGWRRRRGGRGGGRGGAGRALFEPTALTARTAATVAAPASTPPAAAIAALRTSVRSTGEARLLIGQRQRPHRLSVPRLGVFLSHDLAIYVRIRSPLRL